MSNYLVTWICDAEDVSDPVAAARHALVMQRDRNSEAVVFDVEDLDTGEKVQVDLLFDPPAMYSIPDGEKIES